MQNIPIGTPADSAGPLYLKTDIPPEQIFQAIGRLRKDARDEIDRLIRFLDETDDHEPDDDEPECEDEGGQCDDEGAPSGDSEPNLGSLDHHDNQERWASGTRRDLEVDGGESGIADLDG